jgi:hypothetical protein
MHNTFPMDNQQELASVCIDINDNFMDSRAKKLSA